MIDAEASEALCHTALLYHRRASRIDSGESCRSL